MTVLSITFTWGNDPTNHTEYKVFRSTTSFDENTLPAPLTTLTPTTSEFADDSVATGEAYYYMFSVEQSGGGVFYSDLFPVNVDYNVFVSGSVNDATVKKISTDGYVSWSTTVSKEGERRNNFRMIDADGKNVYVLEQRQLNRSLSEYEYRLNIIDNATGVVKETSPPANVTTIHDDFNDVIFYKNGRVYVSNNQGGLGYYETNNLPSGITYMDGSGLDQSNYQIRHYVPSNGDEVFFVYGFNDPVGSSNWFDFLGKVDTTTGVMSTVEELTSNVMDARVESVATMKSGKICILMRAFSSTDGGSVLVVDVTPTSQATVEHTFPDIDTRAIVASPNYDGIVYISGNTNIYKIDTATGSKTLLVDTGVYIGEMYITKSEKIFVTGEQASAFIKYDVDGDTIEWSDLKDGSTMSVWDITGDFGNQQNVEFS